MAPRSEDQPASFAEILRNALFWTAIAFGLFALLIGLKTDQQANEIVLVPRVGLLAGVLLVKSAISGLLLTVGSLWQIRLGFPVAMEELGMYLFLLTAGGSALKAASKAATPSGPASSFCAVLERSTMLSLPAQ